eukprot:3814774-Amphidinium_carterae.1
MKLSGGVGISRVKEFTKRSLQGELSIGARHRLPHPQSGIKNLEGGGEWEIARGVCKMSLKDSSAVLHVCSAKHGAPGDSAPKHPGAANAFRPINNPQIEHMRIHTGI